MANNTRNMMKKDSLCNRKREMKLNVAKDFNSKRSLVTRAAVDHFRTVDKNYVPLVESMMAEIPMVSEKTRELQKNEVLDILDRYFRYDGREMKKCFPKYFTFCGEEFSACPDFMIESEVEIFNKKKTNKTKVPKVELVMYTTGIQKFTNSARTGKSKEFISIHHNMEALGMLMYGIKTLDGRKGIVKLVFDSLKSSRDRYGDYSESFEMAETDSKGKKTDNRIWMEVFVNDDGKIINDTNYYPEFADRRIIGYDNTKLFSNFKETLEVWKKGIEPDCCSKNTCEECDMFEICNYNHRPQKKEEVIVEKEIKEFRTTDEQNKIISYKSGISVVDAGPGSGKTQSISLRVAELLLDGVKPEDICLMSFSRAAVAVVVERVAKMIDEVYMLPIDASKIKIATFNSIGNDIVNKYYKELGFEEKPELIDDVESYELVLESIDWDDEISVFDYKNPNMKFNTILGVGKSLEKIYQTIGSGNMTREDVRNELGYSQDDADKIWDCYRRYKRLMKEKNYIDYADQSNMVEEILEKDEESVVKMFNFSHIIVDEFQDSNDFQMLLIRTMINNVKFESLMVVGDDAQAIYKFRGATNENIINFEEKIGESVDDMFLTVNHRSVEEIVNLGNEYIKLNENRIDKDMTSSRGCLGKKPLLKGFEKPEYELEYTAEKIKELVDAGEKPEDIAFISFKKATLRNLSKKLSDKGVLTQFDMPEPMLQDSRVKAALGLLRYAKDLVETKGLMLYLNELYGNKFLELKEKVNEIISRNEKSFLSVYVPMTMDEKREYIMHLLKIIDDGTDNIYTQFFNKLEGKSKLSVLELIDYACKFEDFNSETEASKEGNYEAVSLVTAHSSKGKEWKYVFGSLSDFDNSYVTKMEDVEERRRLIFVMCTRAKDELVVTSCRNRNDNSEESKPLNKFFKEMKNLSTLDVEP